MRVLALTNWYPPHHYGGYELSCYDVMTRLARRGHDVTVLCSDHQVPGVADLDVEEPSVRRQLELYWREGAPWTPPMRQRLSIERHNQAVLRRALADVAPEVVSVWHLGALSLGLLTTLIELDIPLVYAVCDDWLTYADRLDPWARLFARSRSRRALGRVVHSLSGVPTTPSDLGRTGTFCFVSELTRARAVRYSPWRFPRSTIVYSGIERSAFPPLSGTPDRPWRWRLLFVGRLDARKGAETALRALAELPAAATLTMYGRGSDDEKQRLVAVAKECGVDDRVSLGWLERDELPTAYRDADVLLFPSQWVEPFGLVPVEAMACDTPVVATGVGGSGEFLVDGWNCLQFAAGDPAGLAGAVSRLAADVELRRVLIDGGRATAEELTTDRLADVFEQWHVAAGARFSHGEPPHRRLEFLDGAIVAGTGDPLARHRSAADRVLPAGDPEEIKRLYVDLGRDWWLARAGCDIPVLSAPETHLAVVCRLEATARLVLDAGCGPNPSVSLSLAADPARKVVSLDIGWGTVRLAQELAARQGVRVLGVAGDVEHLPFRTGAFDAVVCDDTIEHLPDDRAGVAELARVAQRDATVVLATPNRHNAKIVRTKLYDRLRRRRRPAPEYFVSNSHLREYTWTEFERLVEPVLRIRARVPVGWTPNGWKGRLADRLVRHPWLHRFSQMIIVEAEPR